MSSNPDTTSARAAWVAAVEVHAAAVARAFAGLARDYDPEDRGPEDDPREIAADATKDVQRMLSGSRNARFHYYPSDSEDAAESAASDAYALHGFRHPVADPTGYGQDAGSVRDAAGDAFWQAVADHYPAATTGDLAPETVAAFDAAALAAVTAWVAANVGGQA